MSAIAVAAPAGFALLFGLLAGGWAGWMGRSRQARARLVQVIAAAQDKRQASVDVSCLWDPHSCLNALNRCIINAPVPLAEDDRLYLVSDHLKLLAQLCHSGGWVSPAGLREWLAALMALQPKGEVPGSDKAWNIRLPEAEVRVLQVQPLGAALLPLLREAGPGADVSIQASTTNKVSNANRGNLQGDTNELASLTLRLCVSERLRANAPSPDRAEPALREWDVQVICECVFAH